MSKKSWRCFHCDKVLTTRESAAEHFGDGDYEYEPPLCVEAATTDKRDLVLKNRELWELLQKANAEVEELTDKLAGLEQVVSRATGVADPTSHDLHLGLQRAEESGYTKGLQDARDAREAA